VGYRGSGPVFCIDDLLELPNDTDPDDFDHQSRNYSRQTNSWATAALSPYGESRY